MNSTHPSNGLAAFTYLRRLQAFLQVMLVLGALAAVILLLALMGSDLMGRLGSSLAMVLAILALSMLAYFRLRISPLRNLLRFEAPFPAALRYFGHGCAAVVVAIAVQALGWDWVLISGPSMEPTLHNAQVALVQPAAYGLYGPGERYLQRWGGPQRGDIVRANFRHRLWIVKRVIGIGGDVVRVKGGSVWVNGQALERSDLGALAALPGLEEAPSTTRESLRRLSESNGPVSYEVAASLQAPVAPHPNAKMVQRPERWPCAQPASDELVCTVPRDHVFVMGDNREISADSRMLGVLPQDEVAAKVLGAWGPVLPH